jgi:PAS domain S-box-containing protein
MDVILRSKKHWVRYGFALVAPALSLGLTRLMEPWLEGTVLPPTLAAIVLVSLIGGLGPGLVAVAVGAVGLKYLLLPELQSFTGFVPTSFVRLALFLILVLPLVWMTSSLRRARLQSETARAQEEQSRRFLAAVIDHIPNMIFVKDAKDLKFTLFNQAGEDLLGWSRKQLLGTRDEDYFPECQTRFFREKDKEVLTKRTGLEIPEEWIRTRHGDRMLRTRKVPILDGAGTPLYLLGVSEDVTEARATEKERLRLLDELERAVRSREEMLGIVSHDLRAPVNTILLGAALLAQTARDPRTSKVAQRIELAGARVKRLIEDILDLARFEGSKVTLDQKPHAIEQLLSETVELFQPLAEQRSVHLKRAPLPPLPLVLCDRDRVLQVLANLVSNALIYSPANAEVTLTAEAEPGRVRVRVVDHGPGIADGEVARVFDRFYRGHGSTAQGTGLGLSIAAAIVRAHDGEIGVDTTLGAGSSFWFTLQAHAPAGPISVVDKPELTS